MEDNILNNELTFMIGEQMFEATAMGENNNHVVVTLVKKDITMEQILAEPVKEKPAANTEKEKSKGIGMPQITRDDFNRRTSLEGYGAGYYAWNRRAIE